MFWDPRGGSFKGEGRVQGPGFAALHFYLKNICEAFNFFKKPYNYILLNKKPVYIYIYLYMYVFIYIYAHTYDYIIHIYD